MRGTHEVGLGDDAREATLARQHGQAADAVLRQRRDHVGHARARVGHVERMAHDVADGRARPDFRVARGVPDDVALGHDPRRRIPVEHHEAADGVLGEHARDLAECGGHRHALDARRHVVGDAERGGVPGDAARARLEFTHGREYRPACGGT